MPVEINLLPRRKRKTSMLPVYVLILGLAGLIVLIFMLNTVSTMEEETARTSTELEEKRLEAAELEQELAEYRSGDLDELDDKLEELAEKVVPVSALLEETVRLMPQEGMMTFFDYQFPGQLRVEVLLTTMPDVAKYQHELENSPMIQRAEVESILGEEINEEAEEDPFWYEEYLPQYFTTINVVVNPDAVREVERQEEEEVEQP
ncbi:PilN domain-containing protein [Alkalicoccus halolimnae]|uniref:PilN domain-containing protein n=1 Tax=Alkalicoccus halolimnae TaxID=1667239 RepID=A0A5C7FM66_9BACI|nr:hypothetical protein [Alkalicoccus halolimnae]TXF85835.1 hypothetical protein FTX54_07085 [Alkalicoccus halolimnae]